MAILGVDARAAAASAASGTLVPGVLYNPPSAGSLEQVWVEILDHNLVSQGPVQFVTMTAQLYYNAVGSWSVLTPYTDALWNLIQAGDIFVTDLVEFEVIDGALHAVEPWRCIPQIESEDLFFPYLGSVGVLVICSHSTEVIQLLFRGQLCPAFHRRTTQHD